MLKVENEGKGGWWDVSWISRASGWQTKRTDCNYVFEKITFLENYFNKDKSVGL